MKDEDKMIKFLHGSIQSKTNKQTNCFSTLILKLYYFSSILFVKRTSMVEKIFQLPFMLSSISKSRRFHVFYLFGPKVAGKNLRQSVLIRRLAGNRQIAVFGTAAQLMRFRTRNCAHRTHRFALSTTSPAVAYTSTHQRQQMRRGNWLICPPLAVRSTV